MHAALQQRPIALGRFAVGPGFGLAVLVAALATLLGERAPVLGAPILAIVLGVALRSCWAVPASMRTGLTFSSRSVLQGAIVFSGFGLSLTALVRTGIATLPLMLGTIAIALLLAPLAGRLVRVHGALQILVSVGTAICGASAIAAVATVIEPEESETALAIAVVFFYNVVAVLTFPVLGHVLGLTQQAFGAWAGTAINDTSSVVAAGYAYGVAAGHEATIVKLTRATMILPIVATIAFARARALRCENIPIVWRKIVPWFVVWFLVAAALNSTGVVPAEWHPGIATATVFLISVALAAIGLQTDARRLASVGARPLLLGLILWVCVAVGSLAIQHATGP